MLCPELARENKRMLLRSVTYIAAITLLLPQVSSAHGDPFVVYAPVLGIVINIVALIYIAVFKRVGVKKKFLASVPIIVGLMILFAVYKYIWKMPYAKTATIVEALDMVIPLICFTISRTILLKDLKT